MGMSLILDGSAGVTYPVVAGSSSALQASAGKVLQVVSTTKTDTFSTASTTFVDVTGLSATITPTSTSSQILVFVASNYGTSTTSVFGIFNLLRGSTNISQPSTAPTYNGTTISYTSVGDVINNWSMLFLDSPATTSATTYKIQGRASSGTIYVNRRNTADSAQTSTITVMEIAA
jgi:hypothetical protein